jgi:hypothetical protein
MQQELEEDNNFDKNDLRNQINIGFGGQRGGARSR